MKFFFSLSQELSICIYKTFPVESTSDMETLAVMATCHRIKYLLQRDWPASAINEIPSASTLTDQVHNDINRLFWLINNEIVIVSDIAVWLL